MLALRQARYLGVVGKAGKADMALDAISRIQGDEDGGHIIRDMTVNQSPCKAILVFKRLLIIYIDFLMGYIEAR